MIDVCGKAPVYYDSQYYKDGFENTYKQSTQDFRHKPKST